MSFLSTTAPLEDLLRSIPKKPLQEFSNNSVYDRISYPKPPRSKMLETYRKFGRHTEAGRLLFRMYNAAPERNSYIPSVPPPSATDKNKAPADPHADHQRKKKEHLNGIREWKRRALKSVTYPSKETRRKLPAPIELLRGRQSERFIKKKFQENFPKDVPPPAVRRYPSSKERKKELQKIFTQGKRRGRLGSLKAKVAAETAALHVAPKNALRTELELTFDTLGRELEDRHKFLKDMEAMGQLKENVEKQIKDEMRTRYYEMKALQARIRNLPKQ